MEELRDRSLFIVFAYAKAGFGHLRVTDALRHGLPKGKIFFTLESQDQSVTALHRLTSVHPALRLLFEWTQQGFPEELFTRVYRFYLRATTQKLSRQIKEFFQKQMTHPKTILIICTHFGLAHQIGALKKRLIKEEKIDLRLIVQVTDDSPQKLWYVPEADLLFVPSEYTKKKLLAYAHSQNLRKVRCEVISYPISPLLEEKITDEEYREKLAQVDPHHDVPLNVMIPISGAAVGMEYLLKLVKLLHERSSRFRFHILVKKTLYTQFFIKKLEALPYVRLHAYVRDRKMVDEYEREYETEHIALEITKPSEQLFKALLNPNEKGGSILLFTRPVGRQEYDNLDFLLRHHLIPSTEELHAIWKQSKTRWRGFSLPNKPEEAAQLIHWALQERVLLSMMECKSCPEITGYNAKELRGDGVKEFWKRVLQYLQEKGKAV